MITTKEETQDFFKSIVCNKEDAVSFLIGYLSRFNASKEKKESLQNIIEEIKWILEAAKELPTGIDRFLGVK